MPNLFDPSVFQRLRFGQLYPSTPPFVGDAPAGGYGGTGFDVNTDFTPQQSPTMGSTDVPAPPQINPALTQAIASATPATPPTAPTTPTGVDDYDVNARMAQLYHPEHESIDKFNQLANAYPNEQPSRMRRLGAAILAGTVASSGNPHDIPLALQTGKAVREEPQNSAVEDWQNKIKPLEQAANIERQNNANERTNAYQTVSQELRQRAQDLKDKNDSAKAEIAAHRASIYEYKTMHPNAKFDFSGPTVKVMDPATGNVSDTGIETGKMTQMDKIMLQGDQKMAQIGAAGDQARQTDAQKAGEKSDLATQNNWQTAVIPDPHNPGQNIAVQINKDGRVKRLQLDDEPITGVTKPGTGAGAKTESASQTRVRQYEAARKLLIDHPELSSILKVGAANSNDFTVSPTGGTTGQYQMIKDAIYGKGTDQRAQAIQQLQDKKLPITEANINYVLRQLQGHK